MEEEVQLTIGDLEAVLRDLISEETTDEEYAWHLVPVEVEKVSEKPETQDVWDVVKRNLNVSSDQESLFEIFKDLVTSREYEIDPVGRITIKMDDVVCADIYGNTTPILDLFVMICTDGSFLARRNTLTYLQKNTSQFIHPHITSNYGWNSICFGNTYFGPTRLEKAVGKLGIWDSFIRYENTNGRPYRNISELALFREEVTSPSSDSILKGYFSSEYLKVELRYQNGWFPQVTEESIEEYLISKEVTYFFNKNRYYKRFENRAGEEEVIQQQHFMFKGEWLPLKVVTDETLITSPEKRVNPKDIARIQELAKTHFNDYIATQV